MSMWQDGWKIGVEKIDQQHKGLVEAVEKLTIVANTPGGDIAGETRKALGFLKQYVVQHFSTEEAYMRSIHYTGLPQQQALHKELTDSVAAYEKKLVQTNFDVTIIKEFLNHLTHWLLFHIRQVDKKITSELPNPAQPPQM